MSVWAPPRADADAIRLTNRPVPHACCGALGLILGVLALVAPGVPILGKLALLVVFGGLGLVVVVGARKRWTTLIVDDRIRFSRPGLSLELNRDAARRVVVAPSRWPLKDPTDYLLEVELGGRPVRLLFAEHWIRGGRARARAARVAERLGVAVTSA